MITPARAKEALPGVTIDAGVLERHIHAATATLGHELGRYLGEPQRQIEMHNGGRGAIQLYYDPTIPRDDDPDPPEFLVETKDGFGAAWAEAVDGTDYEVDGRRLVHVSAWPRGMRSVRVSYTAGYELDEGPAELRDIVLRMVVDRITGDQDDGLRSETIGDYSYTRGDVVSSMPDWPRFAKQWRRLRL